MTSDDTEDMAAVGRALMDAIESFSDEPPLKGWAPAQCPSEIVGDLVNMLEEATQPDREAIIEECAAVCEKIAAEYGAISDHFERYDLTDAERFSDGQCAGAVRCYTDIRSLKHSDTTPEGGENG